MPRNTFASEAASCRKINFSFPGIVGDPHTPTLDCVTKVWSMEMTLMSYTGCKRAAQNPLVRIFVQYLTYRFTLPACLQWTWQ